MSKFQVFYAGNVWATDNITYGESALPGIIAFDVQTTEGKRRVTLSSFDVISETLNNIAVPTTLTK